MNVRVADAGGAPVEGSLEALDAASVNRNSKCDPARLRTMFAAGDSDAVMAAAFACGTMTVFKQRMRMGLRRPRGRRTPVGPAVEAPAAGMPEARPSIPDEWLVAARAPVGAVPGSRSATPEAAKVRREARMRFDPHSLDDRIARMPPVNHPALSERRTIYPTTVDSAIGAKNLLVKGVNSRKIGGVVTKGKWRGHPIYTLTLEERSTCPNTCVHWRSCFVPGTRVLTADLRWQAIETLQPGQKIVGFDEEADHKDNKRKTRIAEVERIGLTAKPTYRILTDRGEIFASDEQLWVAKKAKNQMTKGKRGYRWLATTDLSSGDAIQFISPPWETDTSYEGGRLRGFVEGEGCLSTFRNGDFLRSEVGWSQRPGQLVDEINDIARRKGFEVGTWRQVSGVNDTEMQLNHVRGGWRDAWRFVGTFRPTRLIEEAADIIPGHFTAGRRSKPARVISVEHVGDREVVQIATSTRTLVAEGYLAHNCFGNSMHLANRIKNDADFEHRLECEVGVLHYRHPEGFAIRLHVLGDFYSVAYVEKWRAMIDRYPNLKVFGFTARIDFGEDPVADAIGQLVHDRWDRFAVRFSNLPHGERSTISIEHPIQKPKGAVVCPQQQGRVESCGSCAFCWHSERRVAFLKH